MTSKRFTAILLMAAVAALAVPASSAKDVVIQSVWAPGPMVIDGVAQEWGDVTEPFVDKASGAKYAVKNDGRDLYIIMVLANDVSKSTIDYTGMKVYLTSGPKKAKDSGVLFLQKIMPTEEFIATFEKKGQALTDAQKAELRKKPNQPVFLEEPILPKGAAAPAVASEADRPTFRSAGKGQVTVYEFKVPLSRIARQQGAAEGGPIKVGFEWGGMNKEVRKDILAGRAASGSRASEGAAAMTANDQSGDSPREGADFNFNRDRRYMKHAFWIDVQLATR